MNARSSTPTDFMEDAANGSDSDTSPDVVEYYQPISSAENEDSDQTISDDEYRGSDHPFHRLPNGYGPNQAENGILSLRLHDDGEWRSSDEEEKEEEGMGEASDSAIRRAFMEDESRRNAPLPPENTVRVMEAMRGISFSGVAPDWAQSVPEDRWINQLQTLRQPPCPPNRFGS